MYICANSQTELNERIIRVAAENEALDRQQFTRLLNMRYFFARQSAQ